MITMPGRIGQLASIHCDREATGLNRNSITATRQRTLTRRLRSRDIGHPGRVASTNTVYNCWCTWGRLGQRFREGLRLPDLGQSVQAPRRARVSTCRRACSGVLDLAGSLTIGKRAEALGTSQPGATRSVAKLAK